VPGTPPLQPSPNPIPSIRTGSPPIALPGGAAPRPPAAAPGDLRDRARRHFEPQPPWGGGFGSFVIDPAVFGLVQVFGRGVCALFLILHCHAGCSSLHDGFDLWRQWVNVSEIVYQRRFCLSLRPRASPRQISGHIRPFFFLRVQRGHFLRPDSPPPPGVGMGGCLGPLGPPSQEYPRPWEGWCRPDPPGISK